MGIKKFDYMLDGTGPQSLIAENIYSSDKVIPRPECLNVVFQKISLVKNFLNTLYHSESRKLINTCLRLASDTADSCSYQLR